MKHARIGVAVVLVATWLPGEVAPVAAQQGGGAFNRPPDIILTTKKCVQITTRLGGKSKPLAQKTLPWKVESCWRAGPEITCSAGDSTIVFKVNRETGPKLLMTAEGGLLMTSVDWTDRSFARGITIFSEEDGITHVQCHGKATTGG